MATYSEFLSSFPIYRAKPRGRTEGEGRSVRTGDGFRVYCSDEEAVVNCGPAHRKMPVEDLPKVLARIGEEIIAERDGRPRGQVP